MSLREILELCKLTPRMKLVLAYILARSFWQFYDSPWMESSWSSDSIHFLRETSMEPDDEVDDGSIGSDSASDNGGAGDGAFFASRPCLAVDFDDHGTEGPVEYCDSWSVCYRYPRLLALCIMLLEIAEGRSFTFEDVGSMEANLNSAWTLARRHMKRRRLHKDFDFSDYRQTILSCLNYRPDDEKNTSGEPAAASAMTVETDVFARKAMVYRAVVQPLEKLLNNLNYADNLHIIDPIDMSRKPDRAVRLHEPLPAAALTAQTAQDGSSSSNTHASSQWLGAMNEINASFHQLKKKNKQAKGRHRPVRVALLDTGYDPETIFFTHSSRQRRIKSWKDFAEQNEAPVDSSGHGTHTLALLMKVAPAADIHVARIAKDRTGLQNAAENIAQAGHTRIISHINKRLTN